MGVCVSIGSTQTDSCWLVSLVIVRFFGDDLPNFECARDDGQRTYHNAVTFVNENGTNNLNHQSTATISNFRLCCDTLVATKVS